MAQGRSWDLDEPEEEGESEVATAPNPKSVISWDEISPETLRQSAIEEDAMAGADSAVAVGLAWFEVVLGVLLGIAAMIGGWYWSNGGLGFFVALAPAVVGAPMALSKRQDVKNLGSGLLVAIPVAAVLGLILWYITLFV